MKNARSRGTRSWKLALPVALAAAVVAVIAASTTQAGPSPRANGPKFTEAVAFDVSKPLRELAKDAKPSKKGLPPASGHDTDSEPSAEASSASARLATYSRPAGTAVTAGAAAPIAAAIAAPLVNFEGLSNQDNLNVFGFRVNPPDPVGDVGPNHYVEMVNLVFAVYDKAGTLLLGPVDTGTLWAGFAVPDCTDPSGDPVVVYDQLEDRWILTQFTTRDSIFYNCVAISQTGDPTGAYFRYAFTSGEFFPDYPKYGVWTDSYLLTSRDFGPTTEYGISVYALEKNKMLAGNPKARAVQFFLDSAVVPIYLMGDGLLPADIDGTRRPQDRVPAPFVGTMDDDGPYGAPFDALNVFELNVQWNSKPVASFGLAAQLPVNAFDSAYPCGVVPGTLPPSSRDCLPQPGVTNGSQYLDILSYRQRPTYRLAYRNTGKYETMVTNQSVEARTAVAGVRWYEIRRTEGQYSVYQQGTFSPDDVHRWMGSIAMDKKGNAALGYSVVDGTSVFPGIRYTGRLAGDTPGEMTLGEGTIINGSGVQTNTNSRWGDYTSMNVDPVDDCTFWYVNEYYQTTQPPPDRNWQTRIASFKLPGCS